MHDIKRQTRKTFTVFDLSSFLPVFCLLEHLGRTAFISPRIRMRKRTRLIMEEARLISKEAGQMMKKEHLLMEEIRKISKEARQMMEKERLIMEEIRLMIEAQETTDKTA